MIEDFIAKAREIYGEGVIPLHRPTFLGKEKQYLIDCIDSNFVSSVGERVDLFERAIADFAGAKFGIATVNGTSALQVALRAVGVDAGSEVLMQDLTFVATANAISYLHANPVFLDVDIDTMGLSPICLRNFLEDYAVIKNDTCWNKNTERKISACVPMHTFGNPCRINEIKEICEAWRVPVVEDAAESLGSYFDGRHTGTFGQLGIFSFNGNKIISTGGGGMIVTDDPDLAILCKRLSTTAKIPHQFEFIHDLVAYNFRMPNINAALGCAQVEQLEFFLSAKRDVFHTWEAHFSDFNVDFVRPIDKTTSNHWLNSIKFRSRAERDKFLIDTNRAGVMTRPIWELMTRLNIHDSGNVNHNQNASNLADVIVNIPSSVPSTNFCKILGGP